MDKLACGFDVIIGLDLIFLLSGLQIIESGVSFLNSPTYIQQKSNDIPRYEAVACGSNNVHR